MTSLQRQQQWHPQLPHAPTLGDTDYIFHLYSQNPFFDGASLYILCRYLF